MKQRKYEMYSGRAKYFEISNDKLILETTWMGTTYRKRKKKERGD